MMHRIFWRHGQAGWEKTDLRRHLTEFGHKQAQASANWLREQDIDFPIYCSEAIRARETANYYAPAQQLAGLNPDGYLSDVYTALDSINDDAAIVVGHLPWIGQVIGGMLNLPNGYVAVKTSEVFWLSSPDGEKWTLTGRFPHSN